MVILGEKGQRKTKLIKRALASLTEHETESWEFSDTQTAVKFIARRPLTLKVSLLAYMGENYEPALYGVRRYPSLSDYRIRK